MQCTVQESETNWSSHKKGTAPEKTSSKHLSDLTRKGPFLKKKKKNCAISQERDCSLKTNKDPNQNCRNRSQNASGSLEPCHNMWHGFADRGSYRRGSVSPQAWSSSALKGYSNIFLIALETRPVLYNGVMIQDKPGRVLWSFVLDHSWTSFNQRPSDSRNCCRTREEPLKPCQEIIFSSTLFFFDGDKLIQSFSQHNKATKYAHVEDEHCTH